MKQQGHRRRTGAEPELAYMIVTTPAGTGGSLGDFLERVRRQASDDGSKALLMHLYTARITDVSELADRMADVFAEPPAALALLQPPVGADRAALVATARTAGGTDGWLAFVETSRSARRYDEALLEVYHRAESRLGEIGRSFPEVLRGATIFGPVSEQSPAELFEGMNAARRAFYATLAFPTAGPGEVPKYPANTGVQDRSPGVKLSGLLGPRSARLTPIGNPHQRDPTEYTFTPTPPMFARAMAYELPGHIGLLVSGAVSVIGREIQAPGEAMQQVDRICRNLTAMLDPANLASHGVAVATDGRPAIEYLLAIVASAADAGVVGEHLARHFGSETPLLVVEGELTMSALQVEVECVAGYRPA